MCSRRSEILGSTEDKDGQSIHDDKKRKSARSPILAYLVVAPIPYYQILLAQCRSCSKSTQSQTQFQEPKTKNPPPLRPPSGSQRDELTDDKPPNRRSFRNLSPRARAGVGAALLAWGTVGLYLSDHAEEKFGFTPTDADREALARMGPRIIPIDADKGEGEGRPGRGQS